MSPIPIPEATLFSSLHALVLLDGRWVSSVVLHHPLVISAGRTSEITVPAQIRLLALASDSWNMAFSRHLPYLVQGTATISGSPRPIPIHFSGQIATSAITSALGSKFSGLL